MSDKEKAKIIRSIRAWGFRSGGRSRTGRGNDGFWSGFQSSGDGQRAYREYHFQGSAQDMDDIFGKYFWRYVSEWEEKRTEAVSEEMDFGRNARIEEEVT